MKLKISFFISICLLFMACSKANLASPSIDSLNQAKALERSDFTTDIYTDPKSGHILYSYWLDISKNYDDYPKMHGLSFIPIIFEMQESKQFIHYIYYLSEDLLNIKQIMLQIDDDEFINIKYDNLYQNDDDEKIIMEKAELLIDVEFFTRISKADRLVFKLIGEHGVKDIEMNKANFAAMQWLIEQYYKIDKKTL